LQVAIEEAAGRRDELEPRVAKLVEDERGLGSRISTAAKELAARQADLERTTADLAKATTNLSSTSGSLTADRAVAERLATELEGLRADVDRESRQLADLRAEASRVAGERAAAEATLGDLRGQIAAAESTQTEISTRLDELRKQEKVLAESVGYYVAALQPLLESLRRMSDPTGR
jgi:chromosome segregation ATPase